MTDILRWIALRRELQTQATLILKSSEEVIRVEPGTEVEMSSISNTACLKIPFLAQRNAVGGTPKRNTGRALHCSDHFSRAKPAEANIQAPSSTFDHWATPCS